MVRYNARYPGTRRQQQMRAEFWERIRRTLHWVVTCALGLIVITQWLGSPPPTEFYTLVAVTSDGNVFEAGNGSTCEAAQRHAVIPHGTVSIRCERIR